MARHITKYVITSVIVMAISGTASGSGRLGTFLAATAAGDICGADLALHRRPATGEIANHVYYTFWYLLLTLPMLLLFRLLLTHIGF
jgi:hypothetical protein